MTTIAIYNMKGGVGKTTTAVNLSYLAAAGGRRTLLWDLDPQGASSFAFRVKSRVAGFGKKSLESGEVLHAAIKETDYHNLDLLPADFAYRKFDRLLDELGKPASVVTTLLKTFDDDYDVLFLDCPPGFSLLTEGIFAAADAVLVPAIPTVLSLRTITRLIKRADRAGSRSTLAVFFNMVDRRKTLHRQACTWSAGSPGVFLAGQIPYASVVEQMGVRRMPLGAFAPREAATLAFVDLWAEFEGRLACRVPSSAAEGHTWEAGLEAIESLLSRIESAEAAEPHSGPWANEPLPAGSRTCVVHTFDTARRDVQRSGHVLELHESEGRLVVVAARAGRNQADVDSVVHAQVDSSWALEILSGVMSPVAALDRRLGRPGPALVESIRVMIDGRKLHRIDSRPAQGPSASNEQNDRVLQFHTPRAPRHQALAG